MTVETITVVDRRLVERVNREHQLCQRSYTDALAHAREAGRLLADAKAQLRHGEWLPWVHEHFEGSERTAQVYMRIAATPESAESADMSIVAALRQVQKPKRPTASDASELLQRLVGPATGTGEMVRASVQHAWTDQQARKLRRVDDLLVLACQQVDSAQDAGLAPAGIADLLRHAEVQARKAAALLADLAFVFETTP